MTHSSSIPPSLEGQTIRDVLAWVDQCIKSLRTSRSGGNQRKKAFRAFVSQDGTIENWLDTLVTEIDVEGLRASYPGDHNKGTEHASRVKSTLDGFIAWRTSGGRTYPGWAGGERSASTKARHARLAKTNGNNGETHPEAVVVAVIAVAPGRVYHVTGPGVFRSQAEFEQAKRQLDVMRPAIVAEPGEPDVGDDC